MTRPKINPGKASARIKPTPKEYRRFLAKVRLVDECWVWRAYRDPNGYAALKFRGEKVWAHRWAYLVFKQPLRDGDEVDHRCANPSCVNPAHLRRVPYLQHRSESGAKPRRNP